MEDEQFATNIRPDSIFGSLGASDFEGDDVEEYGELADGWGGQDLPEEYDEDSESSSSTDVRTMAQPSQITATQPSSRGSAALTFFLLFGGAALGWHFGGVKGAAGGALTAGAVRNMYRVQRDMRSGSSELQAASVRPGLIALAGLAGGGYLLYMASEGKTR